MAAPPNPSCRTPIRYPLPLRHAAGSPQIRFDRLRLGHAVADAGLGEYVLRLLRVVTQLLAQVSDENAYKLSFNRVIRSPDSL